MTTTIPNPPKPVTLPWRIVIDTAEQQPFTFTEIRARGRGGRFYDVQTVRRSLGRYPFSYGDYSLESADGSVGLVGYCAVERKSLADYQSTLLEYAQTKDAPKCRFRSELENLRKINLNGGAAMIVVECDLCEAISTIQQRGTRSRQDLAATVFGTTWSITRDYHITPMFCGSRRMAEIMTFRFLEGFWNHHKEGKT